MRPALVMFAFVLLASALCGASASECAETQPAERPHRKTPDVVRPWILVGLSPRGCVGGCRKVFSVIRDLSGNRKGIIVPFRKLTPELVMEMEPEFIVLSPQGTPWCRYSGDDAVALQNMLWTIPLLAEEMNVPILGICGGHQALALAFGGKVGPIRAVEDDCLPYTRTRRKGLLPLERTVQDPIFHGLPRGLLVRASHYDEVKQVPPGFVVLASHRVSPIQIMRHPTRPVYGIQGHPEYFRPGCPDGGVLIRNFLQIARSHNEAVRRLASSGSIESTTSSR